MDGLKGFPEAIEPVFPNSQVQLCIVHLIRNSLKYVNRKEWKLVAADLKAVYSAPHGRGCRKRTASVWRALGCEISSDTSDVGTQLGTSDSVFRLSRRPSRRVIYTTNAIESLNMSLRKIHRKSARASFPSEQAALKLMYLALKNVVRHWQDLPVRSLEGCLEPLHGSCGRIACQAATRR